MGTPYPADWQIHLEDGFDTFDIGHTEDTERGLVVLSRLDENHRITGFRIVFFGPDELKVRIPLNTVVLALPDAFDHQYLELICPLRYANPDQDRTATEWVDLGQLIADGIATVTDENGDEVSDKPLMAILQMPGTEKQCMGASVRWAVIGTSQGTLELQLQCLPMQGKYLQKKAHFKGDNIVSVALGSIPMNVELFDNKSAKGPVPLLFSPNPEAALAFLTSNPNAILTDINDVNTSFLIPENLSLSDAHAYLRRKHRSAKGRPVFQPEKQPTAKRVRVDAGPSMDSGT
jgi:hypothetical protein